MNQVVVQVSQDKQRQRWKDSTGGFREPQHCVLHMYNNKHGNNINNKVYTHQHCGPQSTINESIKKKNKCKLYKSMQKQNGLFTHSHIHANYSFVWLLFYI